MKILMVCLGNICRSPLAEGILKKKVQERGLDWEVDSAGTGSWHVGDLPDSRTIKVARKYGLDVTDQRARQLSVDDLQEYDLILAMDASNRKNILSLDKSNAPIDKVKTILDYVYPDEQRDVPDPYWDDNGFDKIYHMLDEACESLLHTQLSD